ncbi:hypothetical protein JVX93_29460 [Mycolicibacterium boenickei]|nr:hypothetical protein JVX93_29460 [Mycolicibacterium boenickei]
MTAEIDVAWNLVDITSRWFSESDRVCVYSPLGAGDCYSAIAHALGVAVQVGQALPARLVADLALWLEGYAERPQAVQLRDLLNTYGPSGARCRPPGTRDLVPARVARPPR